MPLIKNGAFEEDKWVSVADGEDVPADAPALVSVARWQEDRDALSGRNAPLGVMLSSSDFPETIADDLERFQLVALEFPAFKDGRGYSYARLLRERYGFEGEIRAVGDVLRDQWLNMSRCGIDAFDVPEGTTLEAFNEAMGELSHVYQPTGDGRPSVLQLRHGTAA